MKVMVMYDIGGYERNFTIAGRRETLGRALLNSRDLGTAYKRRLTTYSV